MTKIELLKIVQESKRLNAGEKIDYRIEILKSDSDLTVFVDSLKRRGVEIGK